ncbi:hypothetical protein [Janibacter melonis]|uniref:hypothetical protein n=1 Tax=Janibacter melonis TaxID=262209 RepID=UPI0020955651|nr:hypothetical protein [Janibacter melonis]
MRATQLDEPFHYATGDHLTGSREVPTTRRYGYGRPVFLVGDSMAGQLADGLRRSTAGQHRALLPARSRAGSSDCRQATPLRAGGPPGSAARSEPRRATADGRSSCSPGEGSAQAPRSDRPCGGCEPTAPRSTSSRRRRSRRRRVAPSCVVASSSPTTRCRVRLTDADAGRSATLTAARQASPRISALDLKPIAARGSGPTYSPVHTGTDGPVQIYRGVSNHLTATWSREVLAGRLATLTR